MRAAWESCRHSAHDVSAGGGSPIRSAEHAAMPRSPHISPHRQQVVEWCDLCEKSTAAAMHSSRRSPHPRRTAALGSNQLESRLRSGMAERVSVQPARRRQPQRLRRRDQRAWCVGRAGGRIGRAAFIAQKRRRPSHAPRARRTSEQARWACSKRAGAAASSVWIAFVSFLLLLRACG